MSSETREVTYGELERFENGHPGSKVLLTFLIRRRKAGIDECLLEAQGMHATGVAEALVSTGWVVSSGVAPNRVFKSTVVLVPDPEPPSEQDE